ncbi:UDP-N-acetyl-D-glucosamine 6-dehydrogenase [compost metagenome]
MHLFGVSYKKDVGDVRESPALDIIDLLVKSGAVISYTDPHVPRLLHAGRTLESVAFDAAIGSSYDCAVVTTDHGAFQYDRIAAMPLVVDTRNSLRSFNKPSIFRL